MESKEIIADIFYLPKETPEDLMRHLVDFLGTTETIRALRLSDKSGASVISKMKTPPNKNNMENGGHIISPFERLQFIGEKLQCEISRADAEDRQADAQAGREVRLRILSFISYVFSCKAVPNENIKEISQILKKSYVL